MVPDCTMVLFSVKILLQIIRTPQQNIKATLINLVILNFVCNFNSYILKGLTMIFAG